MMPWRSPRLRAARQEHGSELDADARVKLHDEIEGELKTLLEPEKKRLQANMTQAINRVLDLLYRQVPPPVELT